MKEIFGGTRAIRNIKLSSFLKRLESNIYKSKTNYKKKITKYSSRSTCDLFGISPLIQIRVSFVDRIKHHKINGTLRHVFEHFLS